MRKDQKISLILLSAVIVHAANAMNEKANFGSQDPYAIVSSPAFDHIPRTHSREQFSTESTSQNSDVVFAALKKHNPNLKKIPSSESINVDDLLKKAQQVQKERQQITAEKIPSRCCGCPEDGGCACCNDCCCQSDCCMIGGCCAKPNGDCCCYCGDDCCTGQCCRDFGQCCETTWCGIFKCLGWCCVNFPWEDCFECLGEMLDDD